MRILNENFSMSMPDWLRDRLQKDSAALSGINYDKNSERSNMKKGYGYEYTQSSISNPASYNKRSSINNQLDRSRKLNYDVDAFEYGERSLGKGDTKIDPAEGDKTLLALLREKDIRLDEANFIDVDVSDKKTIKGLIGDESKYMCFLLLSIPSKNRPLFQVYVPGLNDNEKWILNNKQFKRATDKSLLENVKGFCYLDLLDTENFIKDSRGIDRLSLAKEVQGLSKYSNAAKKDVPIQYDREYNRYANENGLKNHRVYGNSSTVFPTGDRNVMPFEPMSKGSTDKSGYYNLIKRFDDELNKLRARKARPELLKVMKDLEYRIESYLNSYNSMMSSVNRKNLKAVFRDNRNMEDDLNKYNDMVITYTEVVMPYLNSISQESFSKASLLVLDALKGKRDLGLNSLASKGGDAETLYTLCDGSDVDSYSTLWSLDKFDSVGERLDKILDRYKFIDFDI